jgi:hypothetical protein
LIDDRRGAGLLVVLIALVVATHAPVSLARCVQGGVARDRVATLPLGSIAADVGRSAIEEAVARLAVELDAPGTRIFEAARNLDRLTVGPMSIAPVETRRLVRAEILLVDFEVDDTEAVLVSCGDPRARYDRTGRWTLSVAVRHRSTGLKRELNEVRAMRVALVTPPLSRRSRWPCRT